MPRFVYNTDSSSWYDMNKVEEFKAEFRIDLNRGGWFSYNYGKQDWLDFGAKTIYNTFFEPGMINKSFGAPKITEELLISSNLNFSGLKNKSVLVLGGGPSLNSVTEKQLQSYDYIFSCNQFFKHPKLKHTKINLILLGDEVNLNDKDLREYITKYNPIFGFEHSAQRNAFDLINFKNETSANIFIFLTRYFSRLGYLPRAMILARLFGANKIDYIGFDGFEKNKDNIHSFESHKLPPPFNDNDKFKREAVIFWHYFLYDLGAQEIEINNLAKNGEFNSYIGIRENVESELSEIYK